jgi:hypothetical protein
MYIFIIFLSIYIILAYRKQHATFFDLSNKSCGLVIVI